MSLRKTSDRQPTASESRASRALLLLAAAAMFGCTTKPLGFPNGNEAWQAFALPGKRPTTYHLGAQDGQRAWHAYADSSASLWRRRVKVEMTAQTQAAFSWWVPQVIAMADLRQAETADSPVRVAFAFAGDVSRLSVRNRLQFQTAEMLTGEAPPYATLMYVWDNHAELESVLPGARSDRVRSIVVERGESNLRRWLNYRRSLWTDFERAFGEPPGALIGIALLTDSDNTKSIAEAWYGEVTVRP
jgi:hypothetical protein